LSRTAAALTEAATRHFRLDEFQDALKDYTEAYRAYPEPALLFDIAQRLVASALLLQLSSGVGASLK
jgi:hypothetical protein